MVKVCKKCGYERKQSDVSPEYECPKCGIIYEKVEKYLSEKDEAEKISERPQIIKKEKEEEREREQKNQQEEWERKRKEYQSETEQAELQRHEKLGIYLPILFNVLSVVSFIGGFILCIALWPENPGYGYEWKTIAYLPSITWLTIGLIASAVFAAIGQGLIYLREILSSLKKYRMDIPLKKGHGNK